LAQATGQSETATLDGGPSGWSGRLHRALAWRRAHPKLATLVGGAGLAVLILAAFSTYFFLSGKRRTRPLDAEVLLAQLDRGDPHRAYDLAKRLHETDRATIEDEAAAAFVLGMTLAGDTDERWQHDRTNSYLLAARYLEEARTLGFPPGRKPEALFQLGRCLYLSHQYEAARDNLQAALAANPHRATEIHRLLAGAHLRAAEPDYPQALSHNSKVLADRLLSDRQRQEARIQRCHILLKLGELEKCRELLAEIPESSPLVPQAGIMRGRVDLEQARQLEAEGQDAAAEAPASPRDLRNRAVKQLREALAHAEADDQATREAMYLIGVALAEMGDDRAAHQQLARTQRLHAETPEGVAAGLLEAQVLRRMDRDEAAVAAYRRTLHDAGHALTFSNPWFTLAEFRNQLLLAQRSYLEGHEYQHALTLVRGFHPIFRKTRVTELTAQTHRAWAQHLQQEAESLGPSASLPLEAKARTHFRGAGESYRRLARLRATTRHYPDDIWHSAQNFLKGLDHAAAIELFGEYLDLEIGRRRPQALVALGESQLTLGRVEESIETLRECIDFHPKDPHVFAARLWAAKAYFEKGEPDRAEQLLLENLQGHTLTPASKEWRDSLFELGHLLYRQGKYLEAIDRLEEAAARYPDSEQGVEGLYLIAEAYYRAAEEPQRRLKEASIESVRVSASREMHSLLNQALEQYQEVLERLNRKEENGELARHERAILRNCYFSLGSTLFELGRYEDAITAFRDASTRYQNDPLVLEAFVQISDCHRRLGRSLEARGALEQAKVVWKRLPEEIEYDTTNYSRQQWKKLLDLLSTW